MSYKVYGAATSSQRRAYHRSRDEAPGRGQQGKLNPAALGSTHPYPRPARMKAARVPELRGKLRIVAIRES